MRITAGHAAIVTGGASGLGLACVKKLTNLGMEVYVLDLPDDKVELRISRISRRAHFMSVDVTDEFQVDRAIHEIAKGSELRVAINSAGISYRDRIITDTGSFPLDQFQRVIDVNVVGTFNVARLAARKMSANEVMEGERGVIINVSSIAAYEGQISQSAYAASKAAVAGLTLPMARDLAEHKIRVASIAPGIFTTPMFDQLPQTTIHSVSAQVPHPQRLGRGEEFASLVEHIIANPMINGENIRLDGALRLAPS